MGKEVKYFQIYGVGENKKLKILPRIGREGSEGQ
jgi:hypothetical protein